MSDGKTAHVAELKKLTEQTNAVVNEANGLIALVEELLAGTGISVDARMEDEGDPECYILAYGRIASTFKVFVYYSDRAEQSTFTKTWSECDRTTKLVAITLLPELWTRVQNRITNDNKLAQSAMSAITQMRNLLTAKAVKS